MEDSFVGEDCDVYLTQATIEYFAKRDYQTSLGIHLHNACNFILQLQDEIAQLKAQPEYIAKRDAAECIDRLRLKVEELEERPK